MRMLGAARDLGVKGYFRPERLGFRNLTPSPNRGILAFLR
jgi:hypothetical protein